MEWSHYLPTKIVSGGQTGVDRAALDAAISLGIPHGGWCPRRRLAEDGRIPDDYLLTEHASTEYWMRTEQNVIDSDATLILFCGRLTGGTLFTFRMTRKHRRPCYRADLDSGPPLDPIREWLADTDVEVLNVAGPRESTHPGIHDDAYAVLVALLSDDSQDDSRDDSRDD
ncbi:MAG: putative molybdenum carrier protein [Pirellulaceae bacterium]|nr:putative molybdenum carrier protein [Planctomycetales bacterium]